MPTFTEVMTQIDIFYRERHAEILEQNRSLQQILAQSDRGATLVGRLTDRPLELARSALRESYDSTYHGFGKAPKFPHPSNLELLLHSEETRQMALDTLRAMAEGGLMDQLGGGFYRYSVD